MAQIKIKVRPKQPVQFPGICAHCAQPAAAAMPLRKRLGRITRTIDVPLCTACCSELNRQSADEERLGKLALVATGAVFLVAFGLVLLLSQAEIVFGIRLLVALSLGLVLGQLTLLLFQRAQRQAALPEKQAIRQSANIVTFSWRATTFEFGNETFAERFAVLNESLLMDV